MRGPLLLSLALFGCSGQVITALPGGHTTGSTLFFTLGADERPTTLRAFDAAALPDPLLLPAGAVRWLHLDRPLERLVAAPDADGVVGLGTADEQWTLPAPSAWGDIDPADGALVSRPPADLSAWLSTTQVPRPPCGPAPLQRGVRGLGAQVTVSSAVLWGDEVLLGKTPQFNDGTGGVFRLALDSVNAIPVPELSNGPGNPIAYVDEGVANIIWLNDFRVFERVRVSKSGQILARSPVNLGAFPSVQFDTIAAGRHGGVLTAVAQLSEFTQPNEAPITHFVAYDEATDAWRVVVSSEPAPAGDCSTRGSLLVLEVDGPGRGIVGMRHGPLARFDLSAPRVLGDSLIADPASCRNARTTLADGAELVVYESATSIDTARRSSLLWRTEGAAWSTVTSPAVLSGQALASVGNTFVAGIQGNLVAVYEHDPDRPELPPRQCHDVVTGVYAQRALAIDEDTILVTGDGIGGAVLLDFAL